MKYQHKEWLDELENRFGEDKMKWAFKCPACGKVSALKEFRDAGSTDPNDAFQNCIGRFTKDGCNWAAYGLLGTMGKGDVVVMENGREVDVFAMADVEEVDFCEERNVL